MLLNIHHQSPAAIFRMFQVFRDRVVFFLPTIQRALTQEACRVVGVCFVWIVVETGVSELDVSTCCIFLDRSWISTSAGDGLRCGQVMGLGDFALEDLRSGCSTRSKLARRAAKVSISLLIVAWVS